MGQESIRRYEFNGFWIDVAGRRLRSPDGIAIDLPARAFDVLLYLIDHRGEDISKERLMSAAWPNTVVEENNLNQAITALRHALADQRNQPRYIMTVPGRGYRFVATVTEVLEANPAESPLSPSAVTLTSPVFATEQAASGVPVPEQSGSSGTDRSENTPQARTASRIQSGTGAIKRLRRGVWLTLAFLIVAGVATYSYLHRQPVFTDKDTVLLVDFVNTTGESVFDGATLKQGLAVQLQQSPYLTLFPDEQVQQTLRLMQKSPDEAVTREVGREIALRQGLKAVIAGTIAKFDRNYSLTLEAINSQTGETIALTLVETEGKDQVLKALSQAATQLREKLGESLSLIRRFDKPLEQVMTSKLEAFQAYAAGFELSSGGAGWNEAIPFYERAVEIDPDFAAAYHMLALMHDWARRPRLAAVYAQKAYALKDRLGEIEQLPITSRYHRLVTGDMNKFIETLKLQKRLFPRERGGSMGLAQAYLLIGRYDQALAEAREAIRLHPDYLGGHSLQEQTLLRLNRFAEAKAAFAQAFQQNPVERGFNTVLYQIAFIQGDSAGMQQQVDKIDRQLAEYSLLESRLAAFGGQWRKAQELSRRAIDLAARSDTEEVTAQNLTEASAVCALFGDCPLARAQATNGLDLERGRASLPLAAFALAMCGETEQVKSLMNELAEGYPSDTLINELQLPLIRAVMELQRGKAAEAIEQLQTAARFEAAAAFWPQYIRGQAFLKLNRGAEAAAEFQKILDHRGEAPLSVLYPLAHLGVARAAAMVDDKAKSQKAYEDFLAAWKDADSDLPPLLEAKAEYAKR